MANAPVNSAREVLAHPALFAKKVLGFESLYKWQEECLNECEWISSSFAITPS